MQNPMAPAIQPAPSADFLGQIAGSTASSAGPQPIAGEFGAKLAAAQKGGAAGGVPFDPFQSMLLPSVRPETARQSGGLKDTGKENELLALLGASSAPLVQPQTLQPALLSQSKGDAAPRVLTVGLAGDSESSPATRPNALQSTAPLQKPVPVQTAAAPLPMAGLSPELIRALQSQGAPIIGAESSLALAADSEIALPQGGELIAKPRKTTVPNESLRLGGDEFLKLAQTSKIDPKALNPALKANPSVQPLVTAAPFAAAPASRQIEQERFGNDFNANEVRGLSERAVPHETSIAQTVVVSNADTDGARPASVRQLDAQSVEQLSSQLLRLNERGENGEIRMRLRPDHLGELLIQVSTRGKQVDLKVKASNSEARHILEESISSLRESMRLQNLSLASVDFGPISFASSAQNASAFDGSQFAQMGWDRGGTASQFENSGQRAEHGEYAAEERVRARPGLNHAASTAMRVNRAAAGSGRLDVIG